jgi:hypothetical protein
MESLLEPTMDKPCSELEPIEASLPKHYLAMDKLDSWPNHRQVMFVWWIGARHTPVSDYLFLQVQPLPQPMLSRAMQSFH